MKWPWKKPKKVKRLGWMRWFEDGRISMHTPDWSVR